MKFGSKLYLPLFGITTVLTISSIAWWVSNEVNLANTLLWSAILVLIWGIYFFMVRKKA
jgi:hypothetical protein